MVPVSTSLLRQTFSQIFIMQNSTLSGMAAHVFSVKYQYRVLVINVPTRGTRAKMLQHYGL
jgi:hypothetical protein